jgi:deazaflavin-dependent oxidoreductase (nitroreductase family)
MWFMNKIVNPLVGLILRSPLHGLMSTTLLLITYHGRKSGKAYSLPVQYAQSGNQIFIVPGMPEQKIWWRNLQGGAPVKIYLRGKDLAGTGLLLKQDTDAETIVKGFSLYLQRFPMLANYHKIRVEADGSFNAGDLNKVVEMATVIQVELSQP